MVMGMEHVREALGLVHRYEAEGFVSESDRIEAYISEVMQLLKQRSEGRMDNEEPRFAELRKELLKSPHLAPDAQDFFKHHRSLQQFWERKASQYGTWKERRQLVDDIFETTLARMEQSSGSAIVDVDVLHGLDMTEASNILAKAKKRLEDGDADGALTLTRTLVESVCKKILDSFGEPYTGGDTAQHLCKCALTLVIPAAARGREHFKQFARSALNIVEHISLYRAEESDAHGSADEKEIGAHQATYAVNLAGSTALFLIECYRATRQS